MKHVGEESGGRLSRTACHEVPVGLTCQQGAEVRPGLFGTSVVLQPVTRQNWETGKILEGLTVSVGMLISQKIIP